VKNTSWRLVVIAAVIVFGLIYAWPREDRPILNMNLGLDLKGGSHLVMRVETDDAVKAQASHIANSLQSYLAQEGFESASANVEGLASVIITGIPSDRLNAALGVVDDYISSWNPTIASDRITLSMPESEQETTRDQAVKQALKSIRNRVDAFGVAEPTIQRLGRATDRILIQLPGVGDPARIKNTIQMEARLEWRLAYYAPDGTGPFRAPTEAELLERLGGTVPPGMEILRHESEHPDDPARDPEYFMVVSKVAAVSGDDLQDARPSKDSWGKNVVDFTLKASAGERFAATTRANIGREMPIVLDGKIESSPTIQDEIRTRGTITGTGDYEEVENLAIALRSGALPARLVPIEERSVGPSLGWDSIISGIYAAGLGLVLVMLFMVIYYKLSGINAVIALLLNLLLVGAVMAYFGATLTLPGISGFILTVGMAVDANVLIFERIREELRSGKTVRGSITGGFDKALSAITDANITTLISAVFLFQFGTGPVKGFALTLSIGILASLFTAIFVSRTIFAVVLGDRQADSLSI